MEVEDIHIDQTIQRMIPGRNERAKKVQSDIIIFQKVEYSEFCFFEHEKPRTNPRHSYFCGETNYIRCIYATNGLEKPI